MDNDLDTDEIKSGLFQASDEIKQLFQKKKKDVAEFLDSLEDNKVSTSEQGKRLASFYSDFRDSAQDAYLYRHSFELWKKNEERKLEKLKQIRLRKLEKMKRKIQRLRDLEQLPRMEVTPRLYHRSKSFSGSK